MEALVNLDLSEQQFAAAMERVQQQIDRNPALAGRNRGRGGLRCGNFPVRLESAKVIQAHHVDDL